jgi:nucleotide-binding universal stress UspA family protein
MYDPVLVPTDGSDDALRAADHGTALARAFGARVHLLNVVDLQAAGGPFDAGGLDDSFRERLRADAEERLDATEAAISVTEGLRTAVVEGNPVRAILDYADEHDVELIAMGTQGRTGVDRYVAGSVAEGVVRQARVPVLTVRDTDRSDTAGEYTDVLLPTDGSEYAARAIEPGLAIAEQYGARVHVLHVVDPGDLPDEEARETVVERLESAGDAVTEKIAQQAGDRGLEAATAVREGSPPAAILDYAEAEGIDLIAMGTAGKTGPSRFLLGSTTERVIRHAEIPVLAVNARD